MDFIPISSLEKVSKSYENQIDVLNEYIQTLEQKQANQKEQPVENATPSLTKADILAIKDDVERIAAISKNSHLFGGNHS